MDITILKNASLQAINLIHGKPDNWVAIAAQFVLEKGWAWWKQPQPGFNVGNVTNGGVEHGFASYANLTDGVAAYVHTLQNGDYANVIQAIQAGTPDNVLTALAESPWCDPPYNVGTLQNIMAQIENQESLGSTPADSVLQEGDKGEAVSELQQDLKDSGDNPGPVDGVYGPETKQAVEDFQHSHGLSVDGIDGPQTEHALDEAEAREYVSVTLQPPLNTLWGIAQDKLGRGSLWPDLMRLNPGIDPRHLHVGDKIRWK